MTTDILLAVAGMTPQVITETLYAILKEEPERFPKEIYIITTTEGAEKIRNNLLGANGKLNEFCNEYGLDSFKIDQDRHLKIIRDADNNLIEDARTREDQNIIADFIFNEVKELTALNDDNTPKYRIHASIAGGRKTMTYLLGATMNILGNPEDKLSHVLVSEGYETNRDFYFPTKTEKLIKGREEGVFLDCSKAKVELSEIPLMRLRTLLTNETQKLLTTYTGAVTEINKSLTIKKKDLKLEIDTHSRTINIITPDNRYTIALEPRFFAAYYLIVSRMKQSKPFTKPSSIDDMKNFKEAFMLLMDLFKHSTVYEKVYQTQLAEKTFKPGEQECIRIFDKLIDMQTKEDKAETFYKHDVKIPEYVNLPRWIFSLTESINNELKKSGNNYKFIYIREDYNARENTDERCFDMLSPFYKNKEDNMFYLNKKFLKAQRSLWENAIKQINTIINKKINEFEIPKYFTINHNKRDETYIINLDPENITII
ncbi:MAG: TIGR02584 family CRISPR-associated protein [Ruminobacter sp.]|nr:TIGR02584 family CRISPR-associated protein [Ruminobacter sp.]